MKITWDEAVTEIKKAMDLRQNYQMRVAEIALSVCDVKHGGNHKAIHTLSNLAKKTGVKYKTLTGWCDIYRKVYLHCKPEVRKDASYESMRVVYQRANPSTTPETISALVENFKKDSNSNLKALKYTEAVRTLFKAVANPDVVKEIDDQSLEEILYWCSQVGRKIKEARPNLRAENHALVSRWKNDEKRLGLSGSIVGAYTVGNREVRLRMKEQNIFNSMLEHPNRLWTPTMLGSYAGYSYDNASAWALRGLANLMKTGHVVRVVGKNKKGKEYDKYQAKYKLTGKAVHK